MRHLALLICAVAVVFGVWTQALNRATPAFAVGPSCLYSDSVGSYYPDGYASRTWTPLVYDSYWDVYRFVNVDLKRWRFDGSDGHCYRAGAVTAWTNDGNCCIDFSMNVRTWVCGTWQGQFTTDVSRGTAAITYTQFSSVTNTVWIYTQITPTTAEWVSYYDAGGLNQPYLCQLGMDNWNSRADGEGTWSTDPNGVFAYGAPTGPSAWFIQSNQLQ